MSKFFDTQQKQQTVCSPTTKLYKSVSFVLVLNSDLVQA